MNNINADSEARREGARQADGKFGPQEHAEAVGGTDALRGAHHSAPDTQISDDVVAAIATFQYGAKGYVAPGLATRTKLSMDGGSYTLHGARIASTDGDCAIVHRKETGEYVVQHYDGSGSTWRDNGDGTLTRKDWYGGPDTTITMTSDEPCETETARDVEIYHDDVMGEDVIIDPDDPWGTRHPLAATPVEAVFYEFGPDLPRDVTSGAYAKTYGPAYGFGGGLPDGAADKAWERICDSITKQAPDGRYYVPRGADIESLKNGGCPSFFEIIDRAEVEQIIADARTSDSNDRP